MHAEALRGFLRAAVRSEEGIERTHEARVVLPVVGQEAAQRLLVEIAQLRERFGGEDQPVHAEFTKEGQMARATQSPPQQEGLAGLGVRAPDAVQPVADGTDAHRYGAIATGAQDAQALVEKARAVPHMEGMDLVQAVTCKAPYDFALTLADTVAAASFALTPEKPAARRLKVAAYDYGIKTNILRRLVAHGCDVRVFPAATPAADLLAWQPDGIFLSNGPGDPAAVGYAIDNVKTLVDADVPMFGICLGHQLLALGLGASTYKLKFGHRGGNHPVKFLETGAVEITSQNHGFAVDPGSLPAGTTLTHTNLYDGTVEGIRHTSKPVFSVQYHPEASPGPHDADYLFRQFVDLMESK